MVNGAQGPEAFGFVLEQDLSSVPTRVEMAVPARWRPYMRPLDEIEGMLCRLVTFDNLKGWDQYGANCARTR